MRLVSRTDYAFRELMYLAVSVDSLAAVRRDCRYGMPHGHLIKVGRALESTGYIEMKRRESGEFSWFSKRRPSPQMQLM